MSDKKKCIVYIVKLMDKNNKISYYTGITNDPEKRLRQHKGIVSGGATYCTQRIVLGMGIIYLGIDRKIAATWERNIKKNWPSGYKGKRYMESEKVVIKG